MGTGSSHTRGGSPLNHLGSSTSLNETMTAAVSASTRTQPAAGRGERLNPPKSSRVYWLLSVMRETYQSVISQWAPQSDSAVLVDFGCGNMPYRPLFPIQSYIGADFPGNELATITIEADGSLPLDDQCASIVLSSQVLEHVSDVPIYLGEALRVLRPGGTLFLSTHGMWRYHPDPQDFWRWTCDGLKRVVAEAGFEIVFFQGILGPEATSLQLWQDAVAHRYPRWFRPWFYKYMQWRIRIADGRCPQSARDSDACVYILVARKSAETTTS